MPSADSDLKAILRYRTFTGKMDRFMFVDSLKSLVRSVDKPVIIIADRASCASGKIYTRICGTIAENTRLALAARILP